MNQQQSSVTTVFGRHEDGPFGGIRSNSSSTIVSRARIDLDLSEIEVWARARRGRASDTSLLPSRKSGASSCSSESTDIHEARNFRDWSVLEREHFRGPIFWPLAGVSDLLFLTPDTLDGPPREGVANPAMKQNEDRNRCGLKFEKPAAHRPYSSGLRGVRNEPLGHTFDMVPTVVKMQCVHMHTTPFDLFGAVPRGPTGVRFLLSGLRSLSHGYRGRECSHRIHMDVLRRPRSLLVC